MKAWLLVTIVAGLLILGGLTVVQALDNSNNQEKPITNTGTSSGTYSCPYAESGTCGGGCTAGNNCGYSGCAAASGSGSCGCGR
jgi:hypothetical protein